MVTVYKANANGTFTNLSGSRQLEPEEMDAGDGDILFLDVLLYVPSEVGGSNTPYGDVNMQWANGDQPYVDIPADQLFLTYDAAAGSNKVSEPSTGYQSGSIPVYASSSDIPSINFSSSNQSGLSDSTYLVNAAYLDSNGGKTSNADLKFVTPSGLDISSTNGSQWGVLLGPGKPHWEWL